MQSRPRVFFITAYSTFNQQRWYSLGRQRKVEQVWAMLSALGFQVTGLNIAPHHLDSTNPSVVSLCHTTYVPLRFFQLAFASARFFLFSTESDPSSIIWLYNTRAAESIVAIIGSFFRPRLRLVLQLEDLPSARQENHGLRGFVDLFTTRCLARRANHFFAVSPNVAESFCRLIGSKSHSIEVLPPALDPQYINLLHSRPEPFARNNILVLYAGSFGYDKGVTDLIQAFVNLTDPNVRLRLVGSAPKNLIEEYKSNPGVEFAGIVDSERLFEIYRDADIVVNPHRRILNPAHVFPFKLIEIVASGALPLSTSVPGAEIFDLPPECFFDTVHDLTQKLVNAREIWRTHKIHLKSVSAACRYRFSREFIQHQLSQSLLGTMTDVLPEDSSSVC